MTDTIIAGSIWVEKGTRLPKSLLLQSDSISNGWAPLKAARFTIERTVEEQGWTFFFMAGEITTTVFGFDGAKALGTALKRLITDVRSQYCNTIEITRVVSKTFLRVPYVSVSAHPRHLQKGVVFSGRLNPDGG